MLNEQEFKTFCQNLDLPKKTIELIQPVRSSPPVRRVDGGRRSVCARYPSKKMGMTIQAESLHCELARIYELEYDNDVIEYYDQPLQIKLHFEDKNGKKQTRIHVPDFLVIRSDRIVIEECKPEEQIAKQAKRYPKRFVQDVSGSWRCPPGEEYAEQFGLHYRVWTPAETNWNIQNNLRFLESYYRDDEPFIDPDAQEEVLRLVAETPGIRLSNLQEKIKIANSDTIYYLITIEKIFVNLEHQDLTDTKHVAVYNDRVMAQSHKFCFTNGAPASPSFSSEIQLEIGKEILWKNNIYTIISVDDEQIALTYETQLIELSIASFNDLVSRGEVTGSPESSALRRRKEALDILMSASPKDRENALRRYKAIAPTFNGEPADPSIPKRTICRWRSNWRKAEERYGYGYVGLLPRIKKKGNRDVKISPEAYQAMIDTIIEEYEDAKQLSAIEIHASLSEKCVKKLKINPPSYPTVCAAIKKRFGPDQERKRRGFKAAYQLEPFQRYLGDSLSRHGGRPFEICHIDHTLGDIELVHSEHERNLGRPWITTITDAYSRRIFTVFVSFGSPSSTSCLMALREFVRKWKRLPESIMSDRGKEFDSMAYETLLAWYRVTKLSRPASKARFGSTDERIFKTINTRFIHGLEGNTKAMKNVREISSEVYPKRLAIWTLPAFYQRLCDYCYEEYDTTTHSTLDISPREKYEWAMEKYGYRNDRIIPYDEQFRMLTLPTTQKGTVKINRLKGIKANYIWYWCDAFNHPENAGKNVRIRYDPSNMGIVYVYVERRWEECISEYYNEFRNLNYREVMFASKEINKLKRDNNKRYTGVDARNMAIFLRETRAQEALLKARLQDSEERKAQAKIMDGGGEPISLKTSEPKQRRDSPGPGYRKPSKNPFSHDDEQFDIPDDFEPLPLY